MTAAFEISVVSLNDNPVSLLLSDEPVAVAVRTWLATALKQPPNRRPLCLTCDAEFIGSNRKSRAWSVLVAAPFGHAGDGIASGVCPRCATRPDFKQRAMDRLRHGAFGGDLQVTPAIGAA